MSLEAFYNCRLFAIILFCCCCCCFCKTRKQNHGDRLFHWKHHLAFLDLKVIVCSMEIHLGHVRQDIRKIIFFKKEVTIFLVLFSARCSKLYFPPTKAALVPVYSTTKASTEGWQKAEIKVKCSLHHIKGVALFTWVSPLFHGKLGRETTAGPAVRAALFSANAVLLAVFRNV